MIKRIPRWKTFPRRFGTRAVYLKSDWLKIYFFFFSNIVCTVIKYTQYIYLAKGELSDASAIVIRVMSLDARICTFYILTNTEYIVDHVCSSDYQEFPIAYTRSPSEYRVRMSFSFFAFLFFGSRNGETARHEKLVKRELWIPESRVQTRRYFLSPRKRFSAVPSLSPCVSIFLHCSRGSCVANSQNETNRPRGSSTLLLYLTARHTFSLK